MLTAILPPLSIQLDPAKPQSTRTTIADYLTELGQSQNEAEGQLIESLKQLDRWQQQAGESEQIKLNLLAIDLFETALRYRKQAANAALSPTLLPATIVVEGDEESGYDWMIERDGEAIGMASSEALAHELLNEINQTLTGQRCPHCWETITRES